MIYKISRFAAPCCLLSDKKNSAIGNFIEVMDVNKKHPLVETTALPFAL